MHGKSNASNPGPRVLMVSQRLYPYIAGAEQQALGLSRALARCGADVRILTTTFVDGLSHRETIEGIPVERIRFPLSRSAAKSGASFHAAKVAQAIAMARHTFKRASDVDVVHAHCLSASTLGAVIGARLAETPVLVKPSLGGEDGELRKLVRSVAARPIAALLRRVDRFAVMSDDIESELSEIGVPDDRFSRVDNGIDLDRFNPATSAERIALRTQLGLPAGPVALFVGQYVPRKGVRELLASWARVRDRFPEATLAFAGHGPEQPLIDDASHTPDGRVVDLGTRSNVADVIRAVDLFVLPTRNESFGNVIGEALACGLPVLVGRTGIARQLDLENGAGRFIDPDAPSSIDDGLAEFLHCAERRTSAAQKAQELVRRFDFDRIAERYLEIYRQMAQSKAIEAGRRRTTDLKDATD